MSKIVRFKAHQQREWYRNQSVLVDANGAVQRLVTGTEMMTMFQVTKHVSQTGQPFQTRCPKVQEGDTASLVEARLEKLPGTDKSRIVFYVDGLEVRGGREMIKARMLAQHGPCQIHALNGKFLAKVHDPRAVQTAAMARGGAQAAALGVPDPETCLCAVWPLSDGSPHPGKHHPVCQWNDKAPLEHRGSFSQTGAGSTAAVPPTQVVAVAANAPASAAALNAPPSLVPGGVVSAARVAAAPPPAPKLIPPAECQCKPWAWPDPTKKVEGAHHPVCEFKEAWEASQAGKPQYMLVHLDTGVALRPATAEELAEGEAAEKTGGVMLCKVGDTTYGLVLSTELEEVPDEQIPGAGAPAGA